MPHDGATAIVVVLHAHNVIEKEAFVEQVEELDRGLVDQDAGTAGVEQGDIQHGHVVTRVLPVSSGKFSHVSGYIRFVCYFSLQFHINKVWL